MAGHGGSNTWALVLAAIGLSACDFLGNCHPATTQPLCVAHGGSAKVDAPVGLGLAASGHPFDGDSCLASDGACSVAPHFKIDSDPQSNGHALWIAVELPIAEGAATHALPPSAGSPLRVTATLKTSATETVTVAVQSGAIAVDSSKEHLIATFDMQLETPDHQRLSVTDGQVSISGCSVFHQDAFCQSGD
jgi:hypothetical protein